MLNKKVTKLEHELNYITEYDGYVCKCSRYFDTEAELIRHIDEEDAEKLLKKGSLEEDK